MALRILHNPWGQVVLFRNSVNGSEPVLRRGPNVVRASVATTMLVLGCRADMNTDKLQKGYNRFMEDMSKGTGVWRANLM